MKTNIVPNFIGKRWLKVILRSIHLVGIALVFVSVITGSSDNVSWGIAMISGFGLFILEAFSNLLWFIQLRSLVLYLKFILLYGIFTYPEYAWQCMITMIFLSGIVSHAPSSFRYYSFIHRKKIASIDDIRG